jgi:predicted DNA-binding transcriptional regulator AlpA
MSDTVKREKARTKPSAGPADSAIEEEYWDGHKVCAALGWSRTTLERHRNGLNGFPKPLVLSIRCLRWRKSEIISWRESRAQN